MQVTIFHNPNCPASRKALETIRARGIEPKVIEYLGTPLSPEKLRHLIKEELHVSVRSVVRTGEPCYAEMGLERADDDTLLAAMAAHPSLMQRPIVVTDKGARLCDKGETVTDLL
ncbi:MAG TPA: arsenate reductase (glutaredoxin) [Rhizomicrobium sp.]|jgi:arsenate reductase|nr:arsenate reductase (glutaredoxin) [Rhizomicrobium sp.]